MRKNIHERKEEEESNERKEEEVMRGEGKEEESNEFEKYLVNKLLSFITNCNHNDHGK